MRILIYGINFWPELTGVGKYTGEMAEWLASRGYDVRVITAPPYYPDWRIGQGYSSWTYRRELLSPSNALGTSSYRRPVCEVGDLLEVGAVNSGVSLTVYRCPLWIPRRLSGVKRLLHLASFVTSSVPVLAWQLIWRPDVVIGVAPPFLGAPLAWAMSKLCGARSWLHIQDFELDAAMQLNFLPPVVHRPLAFVERFIYRRFDRVSTISPKMQEKLKVKGVA
jgi:colanic acid biosynthesis glycosyl transferase WcaI